MNKVQTTQQAEIDRVELSRKPWALHASNSLAEIAHKARDMGWKEKKVQVRAEHVLEDSYTYFIEPFERDCNCPSILKYSDFFD